MLITSSIDTVRDYIRRQPTFPIQMHGLLPPPYTKFSNPDRTVTISVHVMAVRYVVVLRELDNVTASAILSIRTLGELYHRLKEVHFDE